MSQYGFLFDLDGVIVDTAKYHFLAWKRLADELDIPFTEQDNERLKGVSRMASLEIILEIGNRTMTEDEKQALCQRKNDWYVEYIKKLEKSELLPGVENFLKQAHAAGIKIALGSASKNSPLILDRLGITELFDAVVDGTRVSRAKPDPEVFVTGAEDLGIDPEYCVVFEDAVAGVQAAHNAGMKAVGIGSPEILGQAELVIPGLLGTVLGSRFTLALREKLTMVLGFASMAIGINSIVKANQMTPVVIAVIFGTLLGELLHLEEHITHVFGAVTRKLPHDEANFDMERYITVVVLFCASGFGIYGVLVEGMSGSPAVLQSKAVLDLCTAAVFAVTLGVAVAVIALPMLAVMLALFFAAGAIAPFVTPEMLQDFISCGGVLTIVAGMRVSGIKQYLIANMIPALLLVLPASAIWQTLMV